ncbi:bacterio-opsin activator domain-containing protein [Halohasta salina]|uniref:bacterio-opsin activator domain-containing protein n=1 Tax=Halohasta salina TaxID=2961621 RepID=UPI0020A58B77|nr:bacterio-opsin activator domain-containing protein [Halohasta salina]
MTGTRPSRVLVITAGTADPVDGLEADADLAVTLMPCGDELGSGLADTDCVVAVHGEGVDAVDVLKRVRGFDPDLPVVVVADDLTVASDAVAAGVSEFVPAGSPDAADRLYGRVSAALAPSSPARPDEAEGMPIEALGAEEELRLKERAIDEAPVGITIVDADQPDEPMIYINDAFERLTGYAKERAVGLNCRFLQGEGSDPEAVDELRAAVDAGESASVELLNYRQNDEPFWNRVDIAPVHDADGEVSHFVGFQTDITERVEAEMQLERERTDLQHLLRRIDGLLRNVTEELVEAQSRSNVEAAVCQQVAAAETYDFAWIGVPDRAIDSLVATAAAGEWDVSKADLEIDLTAVDVMPAASAYQTGEPRVVTDPSTLSAVASASPWVDAADLGGIAAIPLVYGETTYGVLSVCTIEAATLNDYERTVLGAIGRAAATAINALERGRLIASDSVTRIEISSRDRGLFFVDLSVLTGASLTYNGAVYRDDGSVLLFFESDATAEAIIEAADYPHIVSVEALSEYDGETLFEFVVTDDSLPGALAERGVRIDAISVDDGVASLDLELPTEGDVRAIIELLKERYPETEILSQRRVEQPPSTRRAFVGEIKTRLTERQLTALRKAHVSGFYEWNRSVTGDTLAESMDIGRATYHQHLRAAERKLVDAFFEQ